MTTYLLDANVLIALTVREHEHHLRVQAWLRDVEQVALCPVVEGALVRFLVRLGEGPRVAAEVLRLMHRSPRCAFWPDSVSYADADLGAVHGHRQVTDAYLASVVATRGDALLATLDQALAGAFPDVTALVPDL